MQTHVSTDEGKQTTPIQPTITNKDKRKQRKANINTCE